MNGVENKEDAYYGYRYECLRNDIYLYPFKKEVPDKVKNILVGFGGIDVNNATQKVLALPDRIPINDIEINVILGIGHKHEKNL